MIRNGVLKIALLGNPNTGKTTLFNSLTGMNHKTGNYAGVTVDIKKGKGLFSGQEIEWIDLPGTYSLSARSPDELIAVNLVSGRIANESAPDVILCLADASNLERNMYLVSQTIDLGLPVVVALTMNDLAEKKGCPVDAQSLEKTFKIPFVLIHPPSGKGLDDLKKALIQSATNLQTRNQSPLPAEVMHAATRLSKSLGDLLPLPLCIRALLDEGGAVENEIKEKHGQTGLQELLDLRNQLTQAGYSLAVIEPKFRYAEIRQKIQGLITRVNRREKTFSDKIDSWLIHPVWGYLVFLLVMFCIFQSIFVLARPLMDFMEFLVDSVKGIVSDSLPPGPFTSLVLDGILAGVGGVVVFLPQILMLFGFLAVLEECGYMARAAFLMDAIMARCGLSGKSFIPLLSSLACAVPGIMATRVIENKRDRLVTILVAPLMSCSARLPVYYLLIEAFFHEPWWLAGVVMFILYMIGFITAPIVALLIKGLVFKNEKSAFVLEMPAYRFPSISGVWNAMLDSGGSFLYQAGTLILTTMIIVWALLYFPTVSADGKDFPLLIRNAPEDEKQELVLAWKQQSWLGRTGQFIEPAFQPLGWDWRIGMSVLASFPAREVVIAALGVAFGEGEIGADDREATARLAEKIKQAKNAEGKVVFSHASAFGLLVFFSLCCQCSSTLVVIYKETKSLFWPAFTFVYMTTLAYCSAFLIYQLGTLMGY